VLILSIDWVMELKSCCLVKSIWGWGGCCGMDGLVGAKAGVVVRAPNMNYI